MANNNSLFEAAQLIAELQDEIAKAQAEAKALESQETDLLAKAKQSADSAAEVQRAAEALEAEVEAIMPLLKVMGRAEEAELALSALHDERDALIKAAVEKQEELVMEAQLLWEDHELAKALIEAERKAEEDRKKAEVRKHNAAVARACKALKALVNDEEGLNSLLDLYPKRHGQAAKGKFGDATPDDANSIRLEMLRRTLHGMGFFPSVVDGVPDKNWDEANKAFRDAQTARHNAEAEAKQDAKLEAAGISKLGLYDAADEARNTLLACGVREDLIDLSAVAAKNGARLLQGKVGATKVNLKIDTNGQFLTELQRLVA